MLEVKRFDMDLKPRKERFYLTPLAWLLSLPDVWRRGLKVKKVNMKGLKPPYILLCTHHAFIDFKVTTAAIFPRRANYIVAIDGYIGREKLLRNVGSICKRKFTNDLKLVRHIRYALETLKNIVAIYPEARYSLIGTTAILPESLSKLVKTMGKPVVMLNMHGNHLTQPVWNLKPRRVPLRADMTQIITKEEIGMLGLDDIKKRIDDAFVYDEYAWLKQQGFTLRFKKRAEGLENVLYHCPACGAEHQMAAIKNQLSCTACGKTWIKQTDATLSAVTGETEFAHIPDWYEYERLMVRQAIEAGTYRFEDDVRVESLPNSNGYIPLGTMRLTHDLNGFRLEGTMDGKPFLLEKPPLSMYGLHIEYDYFGKGDCLDLSTLDDTYYLYPVNHRQVVTKLHFATEEIYKIKYAEMKQKK